MGFKISPFEAFDRAERIHDKVNRRVPTKQSKLPTLEEQIKQLEEFERKQKKEALDRKLLENRPRFSPIYEAKMKAEKAEKQRLEQESKKKSKK